MNPLRKAVLTLESRSATLADCFLSLARLAAVLKKLPKSFDKEFRNHCTKVINKRCEEFDDDSYITCFFWIHDTEVPLSRNMLLGEFYYVLHQLEKD